MEVRFPAPDAAYQFEKVSRGKSNITPTYMLPFKKRTWYEKTLIPNRPSSHFHLYSYTPPLALRLAFKNIFRSIKVHHCKDEEKPMAKGGIPDEVLLIFGSYNFNASLWLRGYVLCTYM